jgi:hypothetical protein
MSGSKPGHGFVRWGVLLLVVGVVLGIVGVVGAIAKAGSGLKADFRSPMIATPGVVMPHLDAGTYVVYEQTGTRSRMGPLRTTEGRGLTLTPDQVRVTAPDGTPIQVELPTVDETLTRGNLVFTGAARFVAPTAGTYRIAVATPDLRILVAPSLISSITRALPWLATVAGGAVFGLVGLVLLLIGVVYGRPRTAQPASRPLPAGGWFPDPSRQARLRWWDGQQWTDHTS